MPEAQLWADAMDAQGLQARALPLIDIRPSTNPHALQFAQHQLAEMPTATQAAMFVSAAAVNHFLIANNAYQDCRDALKAFQTGQCRAWATGQGTVRALLAAGVPASRIDSPGQDANQWDSESLWAQINPGLGKVRQVLIVRGADAAGQMQGRDWLSRQLEAQGIKVQQVAAYERHLPVWSCEQQALARQAASNGLWLFSASEAVGNLARLMPGTSWRAARALATHPRIAQAATKAGFGVVCESRPGLSQVMASIKSLQ